MGRVTTRAKTAAARRHPAKSAPSTPLKGSKVKAGQESPTVKQESTAQEGHGGRKRKRASPATPGKIKLEDEDKSLAVTVDKKTSVSDAAAELRAKKLAAYAKFSDSSPYPDFPHPTPEECKRAHRTLASMHGERKRPKSVVAPTSRSGCGDSPIVLDALVRTVLSQNTSDTNSSRARASMAKVYGRADNWQDIAAGGQAKLQEAIRCGGLSAVKSRVILSILEQVRARHGAYSLDHLFGATSEDAMRELLSFKGVGPKTASCVLLFCLQRESFAVDTHVHRITGLLGWRPARASRDEAHQHLNDRIPDEDKYGLHVLLVKHGKECEECRAGGRARGKCELRRAFSRARGPDDELSGDEVDDQSQVDIKVEG